MATWEPDWRDEALRIARRRRANAIARREQKRFMNTKAYKKLVAEAQEAAANPHNLHEGYQP